MLLKTYEVTRRPRFDTNHGENSQLSRDKERERKRDERPGVFRSISASLCPRFSTSLSFRLSRKFQTLVILNFISKKEKKTNERIILNIVRYKCARNVFFFFFSLTQARCFPSVFPPAECKTFSTKNTDSFQLKSRPDRIGDQTESFRAICLSF